MSNLLYYLDLVVLEFILTTWSDGPSTWGSGGCIAKGRIMFTLVILTVTWWFSYWIIFHTPISYGKCKECYGASESILSERPFSISLSNFNYVLLYGWWRLLNIVGCGAALIKTLDSQASLLHALFYGVSLITTMGCIMKWVSLENQFYVCLGDFIKGVCSWTWGHLHFGDSSVVAFNWPKCWTNLIPLWRWVLHYLLVDC